MIRVGIDTSVLVSAIIAPSGPNAQIFALIAADEIRPYVTDAVLAEYRHVFEYERLKHLSRLRIARFRGLLESAKGRATRAAIHERTPLIESGAGRPVLRKFLQKHRR